jgi:integrase
MPVASKRGQDRRPRGSIQHRPNGALRARVYTGYDPVTGKRHYISETIQPGPKAWAQAEVALTKLLNQVDERRNPKTHAIQRGAKWCWRTLLERVRLVRALYVGRA